LPYNEKVWAHPLNKMSFDWVAERVSKIDFKKSLENIILERDDLENNDEGFKEKVKKNKSFKTTFLN